VFTGLIEDVGTVAAADGSRLTVQTRFDDLHPGESVSVDGVCLTVVSLAVGRFTADVSAETRERSTLGLLREGERVNLERPLAVGERLGGHIVLGHVDGVGEIVGRQTIGEGVRVELELPPRLLPLVVEKGSIAVDGISLTVNELLEDDGIALFLIPETLRATTWGLAQKAVGAKVNVEADILGKHVARLLHFREEGIRSG
jgi:riboflavin synthase